MPSTTFVVMGNPVSKGRARAALAGVHGGTQAQGIFHHTPEKTRRFEHEVKQTAKRAHGARPLFRGALRLSLEFRMPIPASWPEGKKAAAAQGLIYHTSKPDLDNLEKAVKDACNNVVWTDDCVVVEEYHYEPCTLVTVETLDATEDG